MAKKKKDEGFRGIVKRLDAVFSKFIRLRDSFVRNGRRYVQCPLCGKIVPREKAQNMHFIRRIIMKYRYDENNCHAGCVGCNVMLHGNYIVYTRRMQLKYGIPEVDRMINDKETYKRYKRELQEKINEYNEKIDEILGDDPKKIPKQKRLKQEKLLDIE